MRGSELTDGETKFGSAEHHPNGAQDYFIHKLNTMCSYFDLQLHATSHHQLYQNRYYHGGAQLTMIQVTNLPSITALEELNEAIGERYVPPVR